MQTKSYLHTIIVNSFQFVTCISFCISILFQPIEYYVTVGTFTSNGYGLCVLLFLATLVQHTLLQNHHYIVIRQGIRLRSAIQVYIRLSTTFWPQVKISFACFHTCIPIFNMFFDTLFLNFYGFSGQNSN